MVERGVETLQAANADVYDHAALHSAAAAMAVEVGNLPFAQAEADTAIKLGRRGNSPLQTALAFYAFALASWQSDPDAARVAVEESLRMGYQTVGNMGGARARAIALAAQLRSEAGDLRRGLDALEEALNVAHADGDRTSMASSLARGVGIVLSAGDAQAAAVFGGAVSGGIVAKLHALPVPERPRYRELLDDVRAALGKAAYDAAMARGRAMSYDELVDFALASVDTAKALHADQPD